MKNLHFSFLFPVIGITLLLTGCSSGQNDTDQHFSLGDTVSTAWFDYTVTEVESTQEYGGYVRAQGDQLVVVELTLKSTYSSGNYVRQRFSALLGQYEPG